MSFLVAISNDGRIRWRAELLAGKKQTIGRSQAANILVDWDRQVSRIHASLVWNGSTLCVECLESARNPIVYDGESKKVIEIGLNDQFTIGSTTFRLDVGLSSRSPSASISLSAHHLAEIELADSDSRIEVLAELPDLIRNAKSDQEFDAAVLATLLRWIGGADSAGVVSIGIELGSAELGSSEHSITAHTFLSADGNKVDGDLGVSRDLIIESLLRSRKPVVHWYVDESHKVNHTDGASSNVVKPKEAWGGSAYQYWAVCIPLPDSSILGQGLYISGRQASDSLSDDDGFAESDLKFCQLVAQIYAALKQVVHLKSSIERMSQFLPRSIARQFTQSEQEVVFKPAEYDVTVLFCDIRGSVRIHERAAGEVMGLWSHLSNAITTMTSAIIDRDGVIGDFQGDSVMGFWGWPDEDPQRCLDACRAAVRIQKEIQRLAADSNSDTAETLSVGIGIASGRAVAGALGSQDQSKISVFGQVVNLASRLESLTKKVGSPILIDSSTANRLRELDKRGYFRVRRIADICPQGLSKASPTYDISPAMSDGVGPTEEDCLNYGVALDAFKAGNWDRALEMLSRIRHDGPCEFLKSYIAQHANRVPKDWDGTIRLTEK